MKKFAIVLAAALLAPGGAAFAADAAAQTASAPAVATAGKMLYSGDGKKLAAVYKVDANGSAQILLDGKMYTVPAATLSDTGGKFTTSLTKKDIFTH